MFLIFVIILQLWILSNSQSINVKFSGILPLKAQDMAMVFYVTAENEDTSATAASVRLEMIKCCEKLPNDDLGCDTIELLPFSGQMTSARLSNYTLIYPTVYPYQRSGVCTVDVSMKQGDSGKVCLKTKIHFDTIFSKRKNSEILKDYFCANKVMKCRSRDLDPLDHCKPVDCYKKYSGRKSYFDKTTATCKAIPKCLPKTGAIVTYDVSENACKVTSPSISEDDLTDVEMKTKKCTETSRRLFLHQVNCHHGVLNHENQCVCHRGWLPAEMPQDEEDFLPFYLPTFHTCNAPSGYLSFMDIVWPHSILVTVIAVVMSKLVMALQCLYIKWIGQT